MMRLYLLFALLPIIVSVKSETLNESPTSAYQEQLHHVEMPIHGIPRPLPRPTYIRDINLSTVEEVAVESTTLAASTEPEPQTMEPVIITEAPIYTLPSRPIHGIPRPLPRPTIIGAVNLPTVDEVAVESTTLAPKTELKPQTMEPITSTEAPIQTLPRRPLYGIPRAIPRPTYIKAINLPTVEEVAVESTTLAPKTELEPQTMKPIISTEAHFHTLPLRPLHGIPKPLPRPIYITALQPTQEVKVQPELPPPTAQPQPQPKPTPQPTRPVYKWSTETPIMRPVVLPVLQPVSQHKPTPPAPQPKPSKLKRPIFSWSTELPAHSVVNPVLPPVVKLKSTPKPQPLQKPTENPILRPILRPRPVIQPQPKLPTLIRPTTRPVLQPMTDPQKNITPKPQPLADPEIESESLSAKPRPKPIVTLKPYPLAEKVPKVTSTGGIHIDFKCIQDGFYTVPNECDSYIECWKSTAVKYVCRDGLLFNKHAIYPEFPCSYPSEVKCEAGSAIHEAYPTEYCPHRYGLFPMNDGECSRYISCQEGLATIMDCPKGLVFNPQKSACDWEENVPNCQSNVFRGLSCPATIEDPDWILKYRYQKSCKQYVACHRGHPRLLRCDAGLAFDEESELCIEADYVSDCVDDIEIKPNRRN